MNADNVVTRLKLGDLLIREKLITPEQLQELLDLQNNQKLYTPLGELCISKGIISRAALSRVLKKYHKSIRLGELLLNMQIVTHEQLEAALGKQKDSGKKI